MRLLVDTITLLIISLIDFIREYISELEYNIKYYNNFIHSVDILQTV